MKKLFGNKSNAKLNADEIKHIPSRNLYSPEWVEEFSAYCADYKKRTGVSVDSLPELYLYMRDMFYFNWLEAKLGLNKKDR